VTVRNDHNAFPVFDTARFFNGKPPRRDAVETLAKFISNCSELAWPREALWCEVGFPPPESHRPKMVCP
jgi:hypothetical protein